MAERRPAWLEPGCPLASNIPLCQLTLLDWGLLSLQFPHYVDSGDGALPVGQGEGTGAGEADPEFELCYLGADDGEHRELPAAWPGLRPETFMPAREFRWARSQKHLPGFPPVR